MYVSAWEGVYCAAAVEDMNSALRRHRAMENMILIMLMKDANTILNET